MNALESGGESFTLRPIAHMESPYTAKFGVPRQAGLVPLEGRVIFEDEFANPAALRGLDSFERIWLIWSFSHNLRERWAPTVRPPRLGGSARQGVFATRSSFRPNSLGLSCVQLLGIEGMEGNGSLAVRVRGADLVDGTPIFDVKPYIPYADAFPDASAGWVADTQWNPLDVHIPDALLAQIPSHLHEGLRELLRNDPRPAYRRENSPERIYWVPLEHWVVYFRVRGGSVDVHHVRELGDEELAELRASGQIRDDGDYLRES